MLTKNLLQFTRKNARIFPKFLSADEPGVAAMLRELEGILANAQGITESALADAIDAAESNYHPRFAGFKKIVQQSCEVDADDGETGVDERRMNWVLAAQEMRQRTLVPTKEAFQENLGLELTQDFWTIAEGLYADLPEFRTITRARKLNADALLARYNCQQVQGHLLQSTVMRIAIKNASIEEKRELFRSLRFHRLLADITQEGEALAIRIDGPLSIFTQQSAYGMRIANFFPNVLYCKDWELSATIKTKDRELELKVDSTQGLKNPAVQRGQYIPNEMTHFIEKFNAEENGWTASIGADFLHLGHQSYCFPDITFTHSPGKKIHLELFHKWHRDPLKKRLTALAARPVATLLLGVERSLLKDEGTGEQVKNSTVFKQFGFLFADFPTPRSVNLALSVLS